MELPVPDVDRVDAHGAFLQQAIGEAAGARADVGRHPSPHVDLEVIERALQLEASARDVREDLALQAELRVLGDLGAGLVHPLVAHDHLAGEDHRLGPGP